MVSPGRVALSLALLACLCCMALPALASRELRSATFARSPPPKPATGVKKPPPPRRARLGGGNSTNQMPIGDCKRSGFTDSSDPILVMRPIDPISGSYCWRVFNQKGGDMSMDLPMPNGRPQFVDLNQLNQLNFAINKDCIEEPEMNIIESHLSRQTWTNAPQRRNAGTKVTYNGQVLTGDKIKYFAQGGDFDRTGFFKVCVSILLPGGWNFKAGDTICVDRGTMNCVPKIPDGSGRIEYVFYLKGERYCPILLTNLLD